MPRRIPVGPFPHYYAIVDDEDYEWLSQFSWTIDKKKHHRMIYARLSNHCMLVGQPTYMHELITGYEIGDHKNRIGLDNRRENLRAATNSLNQANKDKQRGKYSSKFKGVSFNKRRSLWIAYIGSSHVKTRKHLGYFINEEDAALAYDKAAKERFGEFARLNFPDGA